MRHVLRNQNEGLAAHSQTSWKMPTRLNMTFALFLAALLPVGALASQDFSLSLSASSLSIPAGSAGGITVNTAVVAGSAEAITLSISGLPLGVTGFFTPSSVSAGSSSTLTLTASAGAALGTSDFTLTGTAASGFHDAGGTLTMTAPAGGLINGDFETGNLTSWTSVGTTGVTGASHGGAWAAQLGSVLPTSGDSSIQQSFVAPGNAVVVSLWYHETCPDTVAYDWALVTLEDTTVGTSAIVLPKTCANNGWTRVTSPLIPGHSYTLTMISHDDNFAGDPTYTYYDDVTVLSEGFTNGGFETGTLFGWTPSGAATSVTTTGPHSGAHAALLGGPAPTNGDSTIVQTFSAPPASTQLTFWYSSFCPDTVTYDWATATLYDNTASSGTTILAHTCAASSAWTQVTAPLIPGHTYVVTLVSHDDNYSGDPTYTLFDDVTVDGVPAPTPPGFSSISPASGPTTGGESIVIAGSGFEVGVGVQIGGANAAIGAVTPTSISATTPAGTQGPVSLVVANPDGGITTIPGGYTYNHACLAAVDCNDANPCTTDTCDPALGCLYATIMAPSEIQNVTAAADKATYSWPAAADAAQYDVVRGGTGAFPVGPGGGDEICFDNLAGPSVVDAAVPAPGTGFWYLSRGESTCGIGTFGNRSNGSPRTTTTCP